MPNFTNAWQIFADGGMAILSVVLYYLAMMLRVGRDPTPGRITPRAVPPDGVSPAVARYLVRGRYDPTAFICALVSMGVKGLLQIRESGNRFSIARHEGNYPEESLHDQINDLNYADGTPATLSSDEFAVANVLVRTHEPRILDARSRRELFAASRDGRLRVQAFCTERFLCANERFTLIGLIVSALLIMRLVYHQLQAGNVYGTWLALVGMGVMGILLAVGPVIIRAGWQRAFSTRLEEISLTIGAAYTVLLFIGLVCVGMWVLHQASIPLLIVLELLVGINLLFAYLLRAPTMRGRKVLDTLEGFRRYLAGQAIPADAPPLTQAIFERYLPYALALDAAPAWITYGLNTLYQDHCSLAYFAGWYGNPGWEGDCESLIALLTDRLPAALYRATTTDTTGDAEAWRLDEISRLTGMDE